MLLIQQTSISSAQMCNAVTLSRSLTVLDDGKQIGKVWIYVDKETGQPQDPMWVVTGKNLTKTEIQGVI